MLEHHSNLQLAAAHDCDPYLIWIGGALDRAGRPALDTALIEAEQSPARWILLDLEDLTFADSSGLAVIVKAANSSARNGRRLRITRGKGQVARVLRLLGLDRTLPMIDPPPRTIREARTGQKTIPNSVSKAFAKTRGANGYEHLN